MCDGETTSLMTRMLYALLLASRVMPNSMCTQEASDHGHIG